MAKRKPAVGYSGGRRIVDGEDSTTVENRVEKQGATKVLDVTEDVTEQDDQVLTEELEITELLKQPDTEEDADHARLIDVFSPDEVAKRDADRAQRARLQVEAAFAQKQELGKEKSREEKRKKFWPDGFDAPLKQGGIGNCYAVAALWVMKEFKDTQNILLDNIEEIEPGQKWRVTFYEVDRFGREQKVPRIVTREEVFASLGASRLWSKVLNKGSLGDRIYTRAYIDYMHEKRGGKPGETFAANVREFDDEYGRVMDRMLVEGGYTHRALHHFVGGQYLKFKTEYHPNDVEKQINGIIDALWKIYQDKSSGQNKIMAMGSTYMWKDVLHKSFGDRFLRAVGVPEIVTRHAYAIDDVYLEDKTLYVVLVNPHNTKKRTTLTAEKFALYFAQISYLRKREQHEFGSDRTRAIDIDSV